MPDSMHRKKVRNGAIALKVAVFSNVKDSKIAAAWATFLNSVYMAIF